MELSIIGSGTMGIGIAHACAEKNHKVFIIDSSNKSLKSGKEKLFKLLEKLVQKGKYSEENKNIITKNLNFSNDLSDIKNSDFVIEAIIENLDIKKKVFKDIEELVSSECIIASNTSSLSIASIASSCVKNDRVIGIHFFNPAPIMPLVEIIPAVQTSSNTLKTARSIIDKWGKASVIVKDTPGFIVNRIARPFYGEALRIYEEGIANFETIDWALKEIGGFKMGPFELMDYIGNDINYTVTETVFTSFYFDQRYKPSFTQKRMMEAGYLGRKSGQGFYNYSSESKKNINENRQLGKIILWRILAMLINEASDALFLNIASREDIDLAMTKGVNYPNGLLKWADELGIENVLNQLNKLYEEYGEDRYRPSPLLKRMVKSQTKFY